MLEKWQHQFSCLKSMDRTNGLQKPGLSAASWTEIAGEVALSLETEEPGGRTI